MLCYRQKGAVPLTATLVVGAVPLLLRDMVLTMCRPVTWHDDSWHWCSRDETMVLLLTSLLVLHWHQEQQQHWHHVLHWHSLNCTPSAWSIVVNTASSHQQCQSQVYSRSHQCHSTSPQYMVGAQPLACQHRIGAQPLLESQHSTAMLGILVF